MFFRSQILLCLLVSAASADIVSSTADKIDPQPPITVPTTLAPNSSSTTPPAPPTTPPAPPTTKPTTPAPPTTKPTTPAPPTTKPTTPAPPTTKPTTPSPPTTKPTTPSPPPTTPTTPTPKPTVPPTPAKDWIVSGPNGTVCIIANMVMQLEIPYKTKDNKTAKMDLDLSNIGNATATGSCVNGSDNETLTLTGTSIVISFTFYRNTSSKTYTLSSLDLAVPVNNHTFPNITTNVTSVDFKHKADLFSVHLNHSYHCAHLEPLQLTNNDNFTATLTITNAHLEAFGLTNKTEYSAAQDCASVLTPDIVPIVVGIILAGLVVVVLAAYLVGRRRAQARGYLSM